MLADSRKAQEIFHATLRSAAERAAAGEPPVDRLWFFREARGRCLEASEQGLQAEEVEMDKDELSASAPAQIAKVEPEQLAIWISAAPDPQRSALALFYLDEFDYDELLETADLKPAELAKCLADGRREFQSWLNVTVPIEQE